MKHETNNGVAGTGGSKGTREKYLKQKTMIINNFKNIK
jgi:hypothetical protein